MAKNSKQPKVIVRQDPEKPVEKNILAQAIVDISDALKRLTASGVTRDAVVVLVKDRVGMNKGDIRAVLDSLRDLERDFCR